METIQKRLEETINASNINHYAQEFQPHEMLVIKDFLPPEFVIQNFAPEVEYCTKFIHRVKVPRFKKSGSVSRHQIKQHAPNLFHIYQSEAMKKFIEQIVGEKLSLCPDSDPHAVALYSYTEPGDHIGVHYDKSFYKGRRYTVLLGMIQDSEKSKLICYPGANKINRKKNPIEVLTHPGTLVIFNGDRLWHEVSALGENERRVILTMEYLTDTRISALNKLVSDLKDRFLYFGKNGSNDTEEATA